MIYTNCQLRWLEHAWMYVQYCLIVHLYTSECMYNVVLLFIYIQVVKQTISKWMLSKLQKIESHQLATQFPSFFSVLLFSSTATVLLAVSLRLGNSGVLWIECGLLMLLADGTACRRTEFLNHLLKVQTKWRSNNGWCLRKEIITIVTKSQYLQRKSMFVDGEEIYAKLKQQCVVGHPTTKALIIFKDQPKTWDYLCPAIQRLLTHWLVVLLEKPDTNGFN